MRMNFSEGGIFKTTNMLIPLKEFDFTRRPMICAHRGDTSLGAKENTLAAVMATESSGAEMVEVDIQFTTGGDIVCEHDAISDGGDYERFESIVTFAVGKLYLNIELKGFGVLNELPFIPALLRLIDRYKVNDYVLFSSFRPEYIRELSKYAPSTIIHPTNEMLGIASDTKIEDMLPSELLAMTGASTYAASLQEIDSRRYVDIRNHNIHLSLYTVNTREEFDQAVSFGAKGLVTDVPREIIPFRKERFGA